VVLPLVYALGDTVVVGHQLCCVLSVGPVARSASGRTPVCEVSADDSFVANVCVLAIVVFRMEVFICK